AILTLPLTFIFGYPGAALATLVSFVPPWLWTLSRIAYAMNVKMRHVMPWGELARGLALVFAIGIAVWLCEAWLPIPAAARLVVATLVFGLIYLVAGRKLRIITAEDLGYMSRWLSFRLGK